MQTLNRNSNYINKIRKRKFENSSYLKRRFISINNNELIIPIKIVNNLKDFNLYVRTLIDFNENFLLKPQSFFSTKDFNSRVDIILLNSQFFVINIFNNIMPNKDFFFNNNFYNILILENNRVHFYNIKLMDKIKICSSRII